jgi:AbiV family abortive infection protein
MNEALLRNRDLCLQQARSFVEAADLLNQTGKSAHIVYHLGLLALEEVGKAVLLSTKPLKHPNLDGAWIDRSMADHRRKLLWAVWSPMTRIDPADFEAARAFAERAHSLRLASLYVDADADLADLPPNEQVQQQDADQILELARARLEFENKHETSSYEVDELVVWFLDSMADRERSLVLLSAPFRTQYEVLNGDARAWVTWARNEIARTDQEAKQLLEAELARPGVPFSSAKPRWRANATVYTPSHSLRAKVLAKWNERIEPVQFLWAGKKDECILQITLSDNEPLGALFGRSVSLAKLAVACINIGSIGYFWFQRPGFEQKMFKEVRDLEHGRLIDFGAPESFWGNGRAVALTGEHIEHAIHCMMAFSPLSEKDAEPIFAPYFNGLAMIAKSDTFYRFDELARHAFVGCLAGALRHYGGWSGKPEDFEESLHRGFAPFMPEQQHRDKMFLSLRTRADPTETALVNLRTAKQLADLYLIHTARRTWRAILEHGKEEGGIDGPVS